MLRSGFLLLLCLASLLGFGNASVQAADRPLRILFLGDNGPHRPASRFRLLQPALSKRGIELIYTDRLTDLNRQKLADFDGLVIYANQTRITPEQEAALLEYVAEGHGFIPLHCASYCFHNSDAYIALVGAQFQRHGVGVFRVSEAKVEHPVLKDFDSFESWDETYQHTRHNPADRVVLEYRTTEATPTGFRGDQGSAPAATSPAGDGEPWTWVRTHGAGRVFTHRLGAR